MHKFHLCLIAVSGEMNPWKLFDQGQRDGVGALLIGSREAQERILHPECTQFRNETTVMCSLFEKEVQFFSGINTPVLRENFQTFKLENVVF